MMVNKVHKSFRKLLQPEPVHAACAVTLKPSSSYPETFSAPATKVSPCSIPATLAYPAMIGLGREATPSIAKVLLLSAICLQGAASTCIGDQCNTLTVYHTAEPVWSASFYIKLLIAITTVLITLVGAYVKQELLREDSRRTWDDEDADRTEMV